MVNMIFQRHTRYIKYLIFISILSCFATEEQERVFKNQLIDKLYDEVKKCEKEISSIEIDLRNKVKANEDESKEVNRICKKLTPLKFHSDEDAADIFLRYLKEVIRKNADFAKINELQKVISDSNYNSELWSLLKSYHTIISFTIVLETLKD